MAATIAENVPVLDLSFKAAADLSAKRYHIVKLSAEDTVNVCSGATDKPLGVLLDKPDAAGKACRVRILGVAPIVADAAIAAAADVGTSADGQAVTKSTDADYVLGVALEAAGAAAERIAVLLTGIRERSS